MMSEQPSRQPCENGGSFAFEDAPDAVSKEKRGKKPGKIKWIVAIAVFCLVMLYVYPSASGCEPAKMLVILGVQAVPVAAIIALPLFSRRTWFWLGLYFFIALAAYIYYVHIIKIRPFPEAGDISLSGCYVAEVYSIDRTPFRWDGSLLLNHIYHYPAFIKIFDAKTKKCLYTSDFHNYDELFPVFNDEESLYYGGYKIDTRSGKKFTRPVEYTSQNSRSGIILYLIFIFLFWG